MPAALAPPDVQARIVCSISAAQQFGLPPSVMLAVAQIEGGRPGLARRNTNGTWDLGPMQLNTAWLARLRPYGVDPRWALASGCYPYQLAAWRIRAHLLQYRGDYWTRVANYHSRTPSQNWPYRAQVIVGAVRWEGWLQQVNSAAVTAGVTNATSTAGAGASIGGSTTAGRNQLAATAVGALATNAVATPR